MDLNPNFVRKIDDYPDLPDQLKEYCYYLSDQGYVLTVIPEMLLKEHFGDMELWNYEVPVPVKYVLEHGYHVFEDYIAVDVPYDDEIGVYIDDGYNEY